MYKHTVYNRTEIENVPSIYFKVHIVVAVEYHDGSLKVQHVHEIPT